MIEEYLNDVIELVDNSIFAYCHYITPNDIGITGSHQCGYVVPKECYSMFFNNPGVKGHNMDCTIRIRWQKSFQTDSRAIYYGVRTRNEYRITRFGRNFEFMKDDYLGSLQIIMKNAAGEFDGYVLCDQDNIETFMATYNLDITKRNQVINNSSPISIEQQLLFHFRQFVNQHNDFPCTEEMAQYARDCINGIKRYNTDYIANHPDQIILEWVDTEYRLFEALEEKIYQPIYHQGFSNCSELIFYSNQILNRRKSRAGKSLEHHLSSIFTAAGLRFEEQQVTEENKKPDFIFPDISSYHNFLFPADRLTMLGAKTTCKDRWRQVLNEADRIDQKHLFTLQQGVSKNQLAEMKAEHLTLVVPEANISLFHPGYRDIVMNLNNFIGLVREREG